MRRLRGVIVGLVGTAGLATVALAGLAWYAAEQLTRRREPDVAADPAALGLAHEAVVFASRDGIRLGGWFVPAAPPVRGTVIFCHGHAGSLDPDLKYVPAFHRHGYHVLQFDFRAHGRSGGQHVSMGYYERLDLLGAVDFLRRRGIDHVGVLGFSMGGAVAISTAAECPSITAVVSDGGFARVQSALKAGIQQRGLPRSLARLLAPLVARLASWRLACDLGAADPILWISRLRSQPVMLIHAGRDRYVRQSEIEALYAAARNPKELWIVSEAEHRRVDQVRPDEYMQRILAFFDRWLFEEDRDA
jgi:alpha-beta hydrolase superfamily lysophospholipase